MFAESALVRKTPSTHRSAAPAGSVTKPTGQSEYRARGGDRVAYRPFSLRHDSPPSLGPAFATGRIKKRQNVQMAEPRSQPAPIKRTCVGLHVLLAFASAVLTSPTSRSCAATPHPNRFQRRSACYANRESTPMTIASNATKARHL